MDVLCKVYIFVGLRLFTENLQNLLIDLNVYTYIFFFTQHPHILFLFLQSMAIITTKKQWKYFIIVQFLLQQ